MNRSPIRARCRRTVTATEHPSRSAGRRAGRWLRSVSRDRIGWPIRQVCLFVVCAVAAGAARYGPGRQRPAVSGPVAGKARDCARPRSARGTAGTRNSPGLCRAVRKAGSLPTRGRKGPFMALPAPRSEAGNLLKDHECLLLAARVDVADGGAMTQLARPDLARNRSGRDHVRSGPASASTEPLPADRPGLLRAGRRSPWLGGRRSLAGACCPGRGLAGCRRASAGLL